MGNHCIDVRCSLCGRSWCCRCEDWARSTPSAEAAERAQKKIAAGTAHIIESETCCGERKVIMDGAVAKRFTIDCYLKGDTFPVNTYVTDSADKLAECLGKLARNENSGIARVEVTDERFGGAPRFHGMAVFDLDAVRDPAAGIEAGNFRGGPHEIVGEPTCKFAYGCTLRFGEEYPKERGWKFSKARSIWLHLWYKHWKMREKYRALDRYLYRKYPRLMWWKFRIQSPYYRIKNSEAGWAVRLRFDRAWYRYAAFWAPKCKKHGSEVMCGICYACTLAEIARKDAVETLAGRSDGRGALIAKALERGLSRRK